MGELCEAYLGPEYLPGPLISGEYLKGEVAEDPILSPHLAPYIAALLKKYDDIFHVKYNDQDFIIRPLTSNEYKILCKLRLYFDPQLGFEKTRPRFSVVSLEDIFIDCILYPENVLDMDLDAYVVDMLIETAIQYSGWDSQEDIFVTKAQMQAHVTSDLLEGMFTFIRRAHPGLGDRDLENKNIIDIMKLIASAELILDKPFEIVTKDDKSDASKISTEVMIKEDLAGLNKLNMQGLNKPELEYARNAQRRTGKK